MDGLLHMSHLTPFLAVVCYLAFPTHLRLTSPRVLYMYATHNALLATFSIWTFISLTMIIWNDGLVFKSNFYFQNPRFDKLIYVFYISKYYELADTILLYLSGKTPTFLQKYHHVGALFAWHFGYFYKVEATFATTLMNSFIHSIMYTYFMCTSMKMRRVRALRPYITRMQLSQFMIGMMLIVMYYPPVETPWRYAILMLAQAYNVGLIILFRRFYTKAYVTSK